MGCVAIAYVCKDRSHFYMRSLVSYFSKFSGTTNPLPNKKLLPIPNVSGLCITLMSSFSAILLLAALHYEAHPVLGSVLSVWSMLVPSFGASAVLLYAIHESPVSQPRNVFCM